MSKLGPPIVHVNTIPIPSPIREKRMQSDVRLRENYHSANFLIGRGWHKMNLWTISGNWNDPNPTSKRKWNNYLSFWEIGNIKWWSRNLSLAFAGFKWIRSFHLLSVSLQILLRQVSSLQFFNFSCHGSSPSRPQPWRTRPHEAWDETELD